MILNYKNEPDIIFYEDIFIEKFIDKNKDDYIKKIINDKFIEYELKKILI